MRNWYWVRMPKNWKGPAKVVTCLMVGSIRQPLQFNKNQASKTASDFPRKRLFLDDESMQVLKTSGYEVRKAKPPVAPSPPRPKRQLKRSNEDG